MDETWYQVRRRICLVRSEVRDECAKIVERPFKEMDDRPERISQIVKHELLEYNYIFPVSMSAALLFINLTNFRTLLARPR